MLHAMSALRHAGVVRRDHRARTTSTALAAAVHEAAPAPAGVAVVHRDLDLDEASARSDRVDGHRHLEAEAVRLGQPAQEVGADRPLARQRGTDLGAAGAADPPGGEALHEPEAGPTTGRRQHADGEVGIAVEHGIEQPVGRGRGRRQVGVDEQEHVGVGTGGDPGVHGGALAPVVGEPEHVGPGGRRRLGGRVRRTVVDHEHAIDAGQRAERPHRGTDAVLALVGRHDGDHDGTHDRAHAAAPSPVLWRLDWNSSSPAAKERVG